MLIPERVISKLEQQWPNSKLIVSNHDHNMTDTRLLSSPLLYTLVFGIRNRMRDHEIQEQNSKLPELRDILLESPQLRRLNIKTRYSWMQPIYQTEQIERRLLNLPLQPSDRLPPLTELSFSGPDTYELDLEHCQLWSQCMDWSQLYTLNLGISCPQHLFSEIGPQLVGLKELTMGIRTGDRRYEHWKFGPMTCDHLMLVLNFIESVPDLYELNLTDLDASPDIVPLWIVDCQRSLQSLSYHASMHRSEDLREGPHAWDAAQLPYLRQRCPDLAHLLLDFPLVDGGWVSES